MKKTDDSAQLLLIAGFAVGVGIVVLTIMLNNVIYASNVASESSIDTSRYDISNIVQISREAYENAYQDATVNGSLATFNNTRFEENIDTYLYKASENYGISGLTMHMENNSLLPAYFTHSGLEDGKGNWKLVDGVNTTDSFAMAINTSILAEEANRLSIQAMDVSSSDLLWSIEMYNSSGNVNVTVEDDMTTIGTYQSTSGEIDIFNNTIDGSGVPTFKFSDSTSGHDYYMIVNNGNYTVGTYSISGNLTSGQAFTQTRYRVVNPTLTVSSSGMSLSRTLPIPLPGGST
ncbi:hypothetical protein V7O66_11720 [Methanolobus sp. ZRKC3]|uniref:hypothetical protein n=1 Tax=Methanolobus sp. ZRKC3 TaxID=3125786 RepID=UPI003249BCBE